MTIEPFGNIEFNKEKKEWFGLMDNICPNNKVELIISADNASQAMDYKIESVKKFAADYEIIVAKLYDLVCNKLKGTKFEVSRRDIEKIYFLATINLKEDNKTWWLTLEPNFDVTSVYNYFLRFTMLDRNITWTNFDPNTTA